MGIRSTRRSIRVRVQTRGAVKSVVPQLGTVVDLSETGLFFSGPHPLEKDAEVTVLFRLPTPKGDVPVEVRAVVRHRSRKKGEAGMGLQFLRLRFEHAQMIRAFVLWSQTQTEPLQVELAG